MHVVLQFNIMKYNWSLKEVFRLTAEKCLFCVPSTDIYHGRGSSGESIYGSVFEGKGICWQPYQATKQPNHPPQPPPHPKVILVFV